MKSVAMNFVASGEPEPCTAGAVLKVDVKNSVHEMIDAIFQLLR